MKRLFDICCSFWGIYFLFPLLLFIAICIRLESKGGVFYRQIRVGLLGKPFALLKFRTMQPDSDKKGLLTVGANDNRITKVGYYLRKFKLDELPQLYNVLIGDMSLVGPRPEVQKYVDLYNETQRHVLDVKPGITDYASLAYFEENELLAKSNDPERTYIEEVMPAKLNINLAYIPKASLGEDLKIIFLTIKRIFVS